MPRLTRAQAAQIVDPGALFELLASMANPDGTPYSMRVVNPDDTSIGTAGGGGSVQLTSPVVVTPGQFALAIGTGAVTTLTIPSGATYAVITNDPTSGGNIRWTWETTNPDATHGHVLAPGDTFEFDNIAALKLIADAAGTIAQVSYRHY